MTKRLLLASSIGDCFSALSGVFTKPVTACKIISITTAANPYAPEKRGYLARDAQPFLDAGATLTPYDIEGKSHAEVAAFLADADVIYMTGGNSFYLLEHMNNCEFRATLKGLFERGGLYIGSSAGAVVACPDIGFISSMDDPAASTLSDFTALNLVDCKIIVHADHARHGAVAQAIIARHASETPAAVGLNDNQAMWVVGDKTEILTATR